MTRPDGELLKGEKARLCEYHIPLYPKCYYITLYIDVENQYMYNFSTRGRFGFNISKSRAADEKSESITPSKKPRLIQSPSSSMAFYDRKTTERHPK